MYSIYYIYAASTLHMFIIEKISKFHCWSLNWKSNITTMVFQIITAYDLKFHAEAIIRYTFDYWSKKQKA